MRDASRAWIAVAAAVWVVAARAQLEASPVAALATAAGADSIWVAIVPGDTAVAPGGTFDVHLRVTQPGRGFNAYDAVIEYDPAALTFIAQAANVQQGSLMRGACGNTFHLFQAAPDSLVIHHSILCAGVTLFGPGNLYNLRFQAAATPQYTQVRVRSIQFFDAGLFTGPVALAPAARVQVGMPSDAVPGAGRLQGPHLWAAPNPFNPATTLHVESDAQWRDLVVLDVRGHVVRKLAAGVQAPGAAQWVWDGRDERGARVGSGVYVASLRGARGAVSQRLVLVE